MTIRACVEEDLPQVVELVGELAEAVGDAAPPDRATVSRHFRAMARRPGVYGNLVADEEGVVLGLVSFVHYRSFLHRTGTTLVNELVVRSGLRGGGVGGALLDAVVEEARRLDMDEVEVGVQRSNGGALHFYRERGFDAEYTLLGMELGDE